MQSLPEIEEEQSPVPSTIKKTLKQSTDDFGLSLSEAKDFFKSNHLPRQ